MATNKNFKVKHGVEITENLSVAGNGSIQGTLTVTGAITGNASSATKLASSKTISLSGDVSGSTSFDGSQNVTISAEVADNSHNHNISNVTGLQTALDGKSTSTHNHTVDSLSNVTITSKTNKDILQWNGTAWINQSFEQAGLVDSSDIGTEPNQIPLNQFLGTAAFTEVNQYVQKTQVQSSILDHTPGKLALVEYVQFMTQPNLIGTAGSIGFGVGVYSGDPSSLGIYPLPGYNQVGHENYGNYITTNGSYMVYIPKFYYRIGSDQSPRYAKYGLNCIDIASEKVFPRRSDAETAGYALPRAFIDNGQVLKGFFIDKYLCSPDGVGSCKSVPNVDAISLSTDVAYAPISNGMTGCTGILADAIVLSRSRGTGFYNASAFQYSALALLSLAHGQAATSSIGCAWYDPTLVNNFPKGCNNNALGDTNDSSIVYSPGTTFNLKGKTRAIVSFEKTTHNGQANGVADINGLLWETAIGITSPGPSGTSTTQITNGDAYVLKESVNLASLTSGWNGSTDIWADSTNILTKYNLVTDFLPWGSTIDYVRFGNGSNQVFSGSVSGTDWLRTSLGIQNNNNGVSSNGTNLFGQDGCYRYNRMNMFLLVGGSWAGDSIAGVFSRYWNIYRSNTLNYVGFRGAFSAFGS
jgi:hypothetical protein